MRAEKETQTSLVVFFEYFDLFYNDIFLASAATETLTSTETLPLYLQQVIRGVKFCVNEWIK